MSIAASSGAAGRPGLAKAVGALTATQIIGWGTTFHVPAVLSGRIAAGTGLPTSAVFGGITLMLLVAAGISPAVGRALDRDGARRWMMRGSVLMALGLSILSCAEGPVLFGLAWLVFGAATPLALNQSASTALVQIAPDRARRAIALLLLLSGLSTTLAWPFLIWLDGIVGWRQSLVVCAALHVVLCLPLHRLCLPGGRVMAEARPLGPAPEGPPPVRLAPAPGTYGLTAVTLSLAGLLTWGLPLHMIGILRDFGHSEAAAVSIGALLGPGQVLARGFEMAGGQRLGILAVGVGSMALMPIALAALLAFGAAPGGAIAFSIGYGLSAGLISIVRAVVPLRLFGPAAYATILGRLGLPQNVAFATAPLGFALLRERFGSELLVSVSLAVALVCLATMIALARRAAVNPPP